MRIPLTPHGWFEIVLFTALLGGSGVIGLVVGGTLGIVIAALSFGTWLFIMNFFRDPERPVPDEPGVIVAPADGTVTDIVEVNGVPFIKGRAVRIGIFLSVFDVHVNRSPLAGRVAHLEHRPGGYLDARDPACADLNEAQDLGLMVSDGNGGEFPVLVRQIAGLVARRIVCPVQIGTALAAGQRYGMIKVGSRTEVYLPLKRLSKWEVTLGQKVKGGRDILGRLKIPAPSEKAK